MNDYCCWKGYKKTGTSIYFPKSELSSDQVLLNKKLQSNLRADMIKRRSRGRNCCSNRKKNIPKNNKNLSHQEVLDIQKTMSYYDPRSFSKKKINSRC